MKTDEEYLKIKNTTGQLCLTIIMPLHSVPAQAEEDSIRFHKIVSDAISELDKSNSTSEAEGIKASLNSLKKEFSKISGAKGVGIYLSKEMKSIITFPFEVEEYFLIDKEFQMRELLYKTQLAIDYFVLSLTMKSAKLYKGNSGTLIEVTGNHNLKFDDDKEYEHTSIGSSTGYGLKSVEKDKSDTQIIGLKKFYKEVDHFINNLISKDSVLIITGTGKEPALFKSLSHHNSIIIGEIHGNFEHDLPELRAKSWQMVESYFVSETNKIINEIDEKFGRDLVDIGLDDVYNSAIEGKGMTLILERNYLKPVFLNFEQNYFTDTQNSESDTFIKDIGSRLAHIVLDKHGKVSFVEPGMLNKFDGIALIKRYQ